MKDDYKEVNRAGWKQLVEHGCEWTRPYGPEEFSEAREILAPDGWIPWEEISSVLCLGGGGGQQGPLFASLGYQVTVLDISPDQLKKDREVSDKYGLNVETIESDMLDLSRLYGRGFDLVYQPVSAVYVPDVRKMYREITKVIRPRAYYYLKHWNPIYIQIPEFDEWDGQAYRIIHPQRSGKPIPQTTWRLEEKEVPIITLQYIHSLHDLIGGICDVGFVIKKFAEPPEGDLTAPPGTLAHLAAYLPSSFVIFARFAEGKSD